MQGHAFAANASLLGPWHAFPPKKARNAWKPRLAGEIRLRDLEIRDQTPPTYLKSIPYSRQYLSWLPSTTTPTNWWPWVAVGGTGWRWVALGGAPPGTAPPWKKVAQYRSDRAETFAMHFPSDFKVLRFSKLWSKKFRTPPPATHPSPAQGPQLGSPPARLPPGTRPPWKKSRSISL